MKFAEILAHTIAAGVAIYSMFLNKVEVNTVFQEQEIILLNIKYMLFAVFWELVAISAHLSENKAK